MATASTVTSPTPMSPPLTIAKVDLQTFAANILVAANSSPEDAAIVAGVLVWADVRGRHPQGVFRLNVLRQLLTHGLITSPASMKFTERAPAAHHLDAGNGFGQVAGILAVQKAVECAKRFGIGFVAVNQSNHYGAASYYCALAADAGCIGITTTNAAPKVAPYGGTGPVLGTNPIAFGCPTTSGAPILVDFATAAIAGSTIRHLQERGGRLPEGVALDAGGEPTTDPTALVTGSLLPAAGAKGYGLGVMVEILSAIVSGAGMSHEVGSYYTELKRTVGGGQSFIAIDIDVLLPRDTFLMRVDHLINALKASPLQAGFAEILYPGEIRGRNAARYEADGIPLTEETVRLLAKLAAELDVATPW